ncbi:MAE_28990/MAE_18760 family HEPN-like nuclease [Campylobacter sp. CCS1377]|uniref:MAE_28990/MAE_18760 family HEPN-like nuclease n=1 Tax=Campylobacter sp. CCS1377 TaxID=3158229 RepID=A0AAU7E9X5_9BACT|nr:MAE_28990/MAE_18760 family HEPN-like nuclease [Campylobacter jejuni]
MESWTIYKEQKSFLKDLLRDMETMDKRNNNAFYNKYAQSIKSKFVIMLYTILESVVVQSLQDIFDYIKQNKIRFHDLNDNMKKIYFKAKIKNKERHFNAIVADNLIEVIKQLNNGIVEINLKKDFNNENPFNAGSLNYKNIKDDILAMLISSDSIDSNINKFNKYFRINIQEIIRKNTEDRNKLAHGEKSFQDFGSNITVDDLKKRYISIIIFLHKYLKSIEYYIINKGYKNA